MGSESVSHFGGSPGSITWASKCERGFGSTTGGRLAQNNIGVHFLKSAPRFL